MVLASTSETEDLEALASLADRVAEVATPTVSSIETSHLSAEVEQLRTEIADLKSLSSHPPSTSSKRGCSPRRRTPSPALPTCPTCLCWYHTRFAERATKCNQPWTWETNRPVTDGDQCPRPIPQSPIVCL